MKWSVLKVEIINNKKLLTILYLFTMTIAFTTRYGDFELGYTIQIIIGLFWILIGLMKFKDNGYSLKGNNDKQLSKFIILYMLPHVVIQLYTIILMLFGKVDWSSFTTNLTVYVPTLLAIVAIYLIGTNVYWYTFLALILSWCLSVFTSLIFKGPVIFVHAIIQAYINPLDQTGGLSINYLELHDLVLAIGYILIYYLFTNHKLEKKEKIILIFTIAIMVLGMKRVSILGLIFVLIFYFIIKKVSSDKRFKICFILGVTIFVLSYLFIYVLSDGNVFYSMISELGINVMGRNYYYEAAMKYAKFSPFFLGIGRNVLAQIFRTDLSYLNVGGVHSDILKMYIENGFIIFGLWLWYQLIFMLKFYKKEYGKKGAIFYFAFLIYLFMLYLTDNVEVYFICQILVTMLPITYALKQKGNTCCEFKRIN